MSFLFHYTDAGGMLGILQSNTVWATDIRHLNDNQELEFAFSVTKKLSSPIIRDYLEKKNASGIVKSNHLAEHIVDLQTNAISKSLEESVSFFIFSTCLHKEGSWEFENGLLSQWRGYARDQGYAIEFDLDKLHNLMRSEVKDYNEGAYFLQKCLYGNDWQEDAESEKDLNDISENLAKLIIAEIEGDPENIKPSLLNTFVEPIMKSFCRLKNEGFREENECRVMIPGGTSKTYKEFTDTGEGKKREINFRTGPFGILPYIKIFGKKSPSLPITRVIVGPGRRQQSRLQALQTLRDELERDFKISASAIPFEE